MTWDELEGLHLKQYFVIIWKNYILVKLQAILVNGQKERN